jgi:hypothetical protein
MTRKAAGKLSAKNRGTENPATAFTKGWLTTPHRFIGTPPYTEVLTCGLNIDKNRVSHY